MTFWRGKLLHIGTVFVLVTLGIILAQQRVRAETCDTQSGDALIDCLGRQVSDLQNQLQMSVSATTPLEGQVAGLSKQLASIQNQITAAQQKMQILSAGISDRDTEIKSRYVLFGQRVRKYYKDSQSQLSFWEFIRKIDSSATFNELLLNMAYGQRVANQDKDYIVAVTQDIIGLEKDKKLVEDSKAKLAVLQGKLDTQKKFFDGEIAKAKTWQSQLKNQIATLTSKQQQLLAAKLGSLNLPTSLGAGTLSCADDRKIDPGFSNGFAFFTYGIPHRVGMDQYGAYGRAKAGQNYDQILHAYFDNFNFENRDNMQITVDGYGKMSLETYMLGIYEIPGDWPIESLKSQAIAARSYALAYTHNGANSICTSQACQVYKGGNKGGAWEQAVHDTVGKVMVSGGQVITAWYASTAGGYTFTNNDIWGGAQKSWTKRLRDTTSGVNSFGDLQNTAFDRDSPCFYSAQGWRDQYNKSAWLKSEEVADIVNVIILAQKDGGTQSHLSQVDKSNPDGTDTWDAARVRQELKNRGGNSYNNISSVSVSADFGIGKVTSVSVSGDAGPQSFSVNDFTNYFNLRAPSNIQIVGPLFNVERR